MVEKRMDSSSGDGYSHFDLIGERQKEILLKEGLVEHIWIDKKGSLEE